MNQTNAERLGKIITDLNAIESYTDMLYSLALDLDAIKEFRLVVGFQAARRAASFIVQGMRTAYGAVYRLNNGDMSAVWTLALAGQMIHQALELIRTYVNVALNKVPSEFTSKFNDQSYGLSVITPRLQQIADQIKAVVGISLWSAAKEPVEILLRTVQE